ncbi:MAG: ABC transporter substrate-binding protein [Nitrospinae bacterium]|nr:ABC transporter substrate-binding protein [Nitrospinota bacterium]
MKRWVFLIAVASLFSCSHPALPPDTVAIGMETDPAALDPRYAADAASVNVCKLIYAGLFRRDAKMEMRPWLAESVAQKNPLTYRIRIRPGIRFHDGRPLTSADVRYTIESILSGKQGASPVKSSLGEVVSVETPDPLTVEVRLKKPFAPFIRNLTFGIVPEGSGDLSAHPVGAGPFRFASRERGKELALARHEGYFLKKPSLAGVLFKVVPDETVRLLELKKGNIHIVTSPITPAVLPWLEQQEGITVMRKPGTNVAYLGFNMKDKYLSDARVRRAIAHAIDREAITRHLLKGLAEKTETVIAPVNPFHEPNLAPHEYDPALAMRLLDEAGLTAREGKPRMTLEYKTSKNQLRRKIAEVIAEYLGKVGIAVRIKSFEWGAFYGDIKTGNFQMFSLTWVGVDDPDVMHFMFHSKSLPPDGANRGGYANPALDALLAKGQTEADVAKRKRIYGEAQRIAAEDLPYVTLWTQVNVAAVDRRVKGFEVYPDESFDALETASVQNGER